MRILHFSDLHIGVENYGRTDPSTGLNTRLLDFLTAFDELVEYALTNRVDLALLAGDAYKGRDPSQTHQREFAKRLMRLSTAGIPVFLLVGNHDLPNAVSRATAIEIFSALQVPNIHVGERLRTYTISTPSGPLQILATPWPRRSSMLTRDESRGLSIDDLRQEIERRMTAAIEQEALALDPDIPAILTGHLTVNGATVGTERSMMLGQDHVLLSSAVQRPELEYVALGHIHKHQVLREENPRVVYSGSLQRVDFTEEKDDKGFCVIDLEPRAPRGHRVQDYQFHHVKARPFVTIDVRVGVDEDDPTDAALRAIARRDVAGAMARMRITLTAEQARLLREADLRRALAEAHCIAAINRDITDQARARIVVNSLDEIQPAQALRQYLTSRNMDATRQENVLRHAAELLEAEQAELAGN